MKKPRILRRRTICRNAFVTIQEIQTDFGDHRKTYYVSDYGERVGAVVLRGRDVLLVSQFRFLLGRPSWEIPGGRIEAGETPLQAAMREVREEAGIRCGRLTRLLVYMPGTDVLQNRTTIFVGRARNEALRADGREIRSSRWVPLERCLRWIRKGMVIDGLTVAALLALVAFRPVLKRPLRTS